MATGVFSYRDGSGSTKQIANPADYQEYNIVIGNGDVNNATTSTAMLYSDPMGGGTSESIYPGGSYYSTKVFRSCKFVS